MAEMITNRPERKGKKGVQYRPEGFEIESLTGQDFIPPRPAEVGMSPRFSRETTSRPPEETGIEPIEAEPHYAELGGEEGTVAGGQFRGKVSDLIGAMKKIKGYEETLARAKAPPKPVPGQEPLTFTFEDREKFRKMVINKDLFGRDPYSTDPEVLVQSQLSQLLPKQFESFFSAIPLTWEQREQLTTEQQKAWTEYRQSMEGQLRRSAKSSVGTARAYLDEQLKRWDMKAKEIQARVARKAQGPVTKELWNDEKKAMTLHEWKDGKWVDTGKATEAPEAPSDKVPDRIVRALNYIKKIVGKTKAPVALQFFSMSPKELPKEVLKGDVDKLSNTTIEGIPDDQLPLYKRLLKEVEDYFKVGKSKESLSGASEYSVIVRDSKNNKLKGYNTKSGKWENIQLD